MSIRRVISAFFAAVRWVGVVWFALTLTSFKQIHFPTTDRLFVKLKSGLREAQNFVSSSGWTIL